MPEETPLEILLLPGLLFLVGAIIYVVAYLRSVDFDEMPRFRWSALVFFAVALIFGVQNEWKMYGDPAGSMYRDIISKKVLVANHGTFFLPFLGLIAVLVVEKMMRNRSRIAD